MSSTQYKIYRKQTFNLAKTLVVKLDEVSVAINTDLSIRNKPLFDENLRAEFPHVPIEAFYKYYSNLSGQYHISDLIHLKETTGHPYMTIKLLGNSGPYEVDFTKELLQNDPAVANEYRFGSYYYNELVSRYPDLEQLIMGILYPVKLEIAVAAKNGEILYVGGYIKDYLPDSKDTGYIETTRVTSNGVIEEQEINFIPKLQSWIDKYVFRWTNIEYAITDDLYVPASMSVMYMQLPAVIMNIRLENCHTPYAHSFHIKEYLESHGRLGHVFEHLPIEVTLWLYRNMTYYESNLGKEQTLQDVIKNVFTPARIPLSGYDTTHNVGLMPDKILPTAALVKEVLNFDSIASSRGSKSINSVLLDGIHNARDNERDIREAHVRITDKITYNRDDTLSTKILESEMLSLPGRYPFTLTDALLNLWLYSCDESDKDNKSLDGAIFVTNPLTGSRISMTLVNAYKVALYCFNKGSTGVELLRPPSSEVLRARMIPRSSDYVPTVAHKFKPTPTKLWRNTHKCSPEEVAEMYSVVEHKRHFKNADELNAAGTNIFLEMVRQFNLYTGVEDLHGRAELEVTMNRHYWADIPCEITIPVDYPLWLEQVGVNLDGLTDENLLDLGLDLVASATGLDLSLTKSRAEAQRAAISVLKHFTSYTVQIIDSVSFDKGLTMDSKVLRIGNINNSFRRSSIGKLILSLDANISARMNFSRVYEEFGLGIAFVSESHERMRVPISVPVVEVKPSRIQLRASIQIATPNVLRASIDIPQFYSEDVPPPPVTEAKDTTFYASEEYPKPTDE